MRSRDTSVPDDAIIRRRTRRWVWAPVTRRGYTGARMRRIIPLPQIRIRAWRWICAPTNRRGCMRCAACLSRIRLTVCVHWSVARGNRPIWATSGADIRGLWLSFVGPVWLKIARARATWADIRGLGSFFVGTVWLKIAQTRAAGVRPPRWPNWWRVAVFILSPSIHIAEASKKYRMNG